MDTWNALELRKWNPYSRADWAESRRWFRPPRDGPSVSTRLRDYAASGGDRRRHRRLQQVWRNLNVWTRGANQTATTRRMSKVVQDAALAAL